MKKMLSFTCTTEQQMARTKTIVICKDYLAFLAVLSTGQNNWRASASFPGFPKVLKGKALGARLTGHESIFQRLFLERILQNQAGHLKQKSNHLYTFNRNIISNGKRSLKNQIIVHLKRGPAGKKL